MNWGGPLQKWREKGLRVPFSQRFCQVTTLQKSNKSTVLLFPTYFRYGGPWPGAGNRRRRSLISCACGDAGCKLGSALRCRPWGHGARSSAADPPPGNVAVAHLAQQMPWLSSRPSRRAQQSCSRRCLRHKYQPEVRCICGILCFREGIPRIRKWAGCGGRWGHPRC